MLYCENNSQRVLEKGEILKIPKSHVKGWDKVTAAYRSKSLIFRVHCHFWTWTSNGNLYSPRV